MEKQQTERPGAANFQKNTSEVEVRVKPDALTLRQVENFQRSIGGSVKRDIALLKKYKLIDC